MFGDPCPGTHKYLEAHYTCISALQTTTTTTVRPSPPWLRAPLPPPNLNGTAFGRPPVVPAYVSPPAAMLPPRTPASVLQFSSTTPLMTSVLITSIKPTTPATPTAANAIEQTSTYPTKTFTALTHMHADGVNDVVESSITVNATQKILPTATIVSTQSLSTLSSLSTTVEHNIDNTTHFSSTTYNVPHVASNGDVTVPDASATPESSFYCGATRKRNLFWNITRVGEVNVQPCPDGATGIAKWRCVFVQRRPDLYDELEEEDNKNTNNTFNLNGCDNVNHSNCSMNLSNLVSRLSHRLRGYGPTWHPSTPDLTQCRSLWLNNLEVRVNQADSSLISIANDLSEVTSSKDLYGGDMLVTTKIIQLMSEKMLRNMETFPDQRQREAVILELLHGVVKTGSNLLNESKSWLDLNQEDQMRVATSLLTGLEYSAFLLADTITKERNVVQKDKNILLSVRVLETKNIQTHEIFPEPGQWQISDDRIEIPRAALIENSENGLVRVVFATFDRLETILKPTYDDFDDKSAHKIVRNTVIISNETEVDAQTQRLRILNSKVISASLGKGRHTQLSQPIRLVLRHIKTKNVTNPTCVFWNYIDHAWSANGCSLESTNRTHSICMCNHLTNFAILIDVIDDRGNSLFGMFNGNMRLMIYISVAICVVFILIALMTLKFFNGDIFIKVSGLNVAHQQHQLPQAALRGGSRAGSRRQANNIRDQTHEPLTLVNNNNNNNNINNMNNQLAHVQQQQQLNLQHLQHMLDAVNNQRQAIATTNFMPCNSMRNHFQRSNNVNVNNFQIQQLQQQQQQQQQQLEQQQQQQIVATAAAAAAAAGSGVVLTNGVGHQRNINNLNINFNVQTHATTATNINNNHATCSSLQQNCGIHAYMCNNLNINSNHANRHNNINQLNNTDNIIIQSNMNDTQYKWWWW